MSTIDADRVVGARPEKRLSTTLRIWMTFDGSTVAPKELGHLTVPDPEGLKTMQTVPTPFGGTRASREDVAMLLRSIADDLEEGRR